MSELIAGVDEVGVGPLAGPVIACAVILDPSHKVYKLKDSKQLSAAQREVLYERIMAKAIAVSIGRAEVEEIDQLNIFHATMLAMERAIKGLAITPHQILIDGRAHPKLDLPMKAIVGGDQLIKSISAASIVAKVTRDHEMTLLSQKYPQYGFENHKGYSTKEHQMLLKQHGVSPIHRRSFRFVKEILDVDQKSL